MAQLEGLRLLTFRFDILNKVIRSIVKPHEKSPEEGSEDGKPRAPLRSW